MLLGEKFQAFVENSPVCVTPALAAWIEQADDSCRHEIASAEIARLCKITFEARPRKIAHKIAAVVLLGNHMHCHASLDLEACLQGEAFLSGFFIERRTDRFQNIVKQQAVMLFLHGGIIPKCPRHAIECGAAQSGKGGLQWRPGCDP